MKRLGQRGIIKNVSASWLGLAVNVVTGLVVSPYILHKLGDEAFGVWVLVFAITGYYGLFDFGIRSSVIRYVARFRAVDNQEDLSSLVNTALFIYSCVGFLLLIITFIGSYFVGEIFRVRPQDVHTVRILFLMVGTSLSLGFPLAVFGGILEGLQKFYLLNLINIVNTILRTILVVVVLNRGYGLLMVALVTVVFPLINGAINGINALRLTRVQLRFRHVSRRMFKEVVNYGSATFIIAVASKLRFRTDAMIIGTFLSAAYVAYFAIGSRLLDYAGDLVSSLAQIFVPMSSAVHAKGDMQQLRKIFVAGNRACALIIFPISAIFLLLGKSVIEVWVGAKYIATSYPILVVLLIPNTLLLAQAASGRILYGMAEHRKWAWIVLIEGAANVILSVFLVRQYGVLGDAFGTAIPMACTMIIFLPRYMCKLLDIRMLSYLMEAFTLPFVLCTPLLVALIAMQRWFVPHTYFQLAVQLAIAGVVYGTGLLWALKSNRLWSVRELPARKKSEMVVPITKAYQPGEVVER
jgi:O-antigen/teichoic acid export membrane protein